ncbi:FAD-dependent oxidoreductase [Olivibacter sp. SDN3]|uniref:FAD-dependent oxidoreductase n=1 Tax=Olivibacter sp. SDN3 TaxID=2764720 RepID=UPI001651709C|nr:FAD-dependent oxidoreductase [Olivibacter sp. SDN3]QNL49279.1 FAD-dependent oxidoreductase [Olivibacter sp. SDN3]
MKSIIVYSLLCCLLSTISAKTKQTTEYDLCIYGATSAGVIAAYTAAKAGKSVVLIDPGKRFGGMSAGGLGYTDIGNKYVVKGLALDFYRKIGQHYGTLEQWIFEPKVADSIFQSYIQAIDIDVLFEKTLIAVHKKETQIAKIEVQAVSEANEEPLSVSAKIFLDCSYEGDLMAKAGVSYHVGREDNQVYDETLNGVQLMDGHQFPDGIDPYVIPGDSSSGLLWGINAHTLQPDGTGDQKVQAYNYRIALTNVPENRLPIEKPTNYDPTKYELLKRLKEKRPWKGLNDVFIWSLMPNGKTDINNRNGFSTDMIGMNWEYPEADFRKRQEIIKNHEDYTKGLLYFVGNDPSVPAFIREEMQKWGYPKDEYLENNHWTPQLYIRESRRMIGETVMTQHHCQGRTVVDDDIGYAAYTMDSHNCDRLVVNGMVKNEGNVEVGGFPPFPIAYGAIIPKANECTNLLVPVCLSASHIAYGSIRMEPVFMVLAQSAAFAACEAIDAKSTVQQVQISKIKEKWIQNPKGDGRVPDRWVDSQDEKSVTYTGTWEQETKGGFGLAYKKADKADQPSTANFKLIDLEAGYYDIYTYFPKLEGTSNVVTYKIYNGDQVVTKELDLASVQIEGQTSGEWLPLGNYQINGKQSFIEVSNEDADGIITVNSLLFIPKGND